VRQAWFAVAQLPFSERASTSALQLAAELVVPKRAEDKSVTHKTITGDVNLLKSKLRQRWGALADDVLMHAEGNMVHLVDLIHQRTGESRKQIEQFVSAISDEAGNTEIKVADVASEYSPLSDGAAAQAELARERALETYNDAQELFRPRSAQAVGFALGASFLVGLIVGFAVGARV
jgi:hypothetical protein